jgi:glycogen operon protein
MHDVDKLSAFFDVIQQDPVVSQVKLIAEPWDVGEGGYQVGEFPPLWTEWNGKFRDAVRDFWRGAEPGVAELGFRLSGSSDLYQDDGRRPFASINFVTAHDGFTLRDLVSYERKHNDANGEGNRDGTDDNRSTNHGVEGPTDDPRIRGVRARQMRNLMSTLLLATGVPMITAGDEIGRTQGGNNNAYCQDNETSWLDWRLDDEAEAFLDFTRRLIAFRRSHPVFRQRSFFLGRAVAEDGVKDLAWFTPEGRELTDADWFAPSVRTLGMYLSGTGIRTRGPRGEPIVDDSFLVLLHAGAEVVDFTLPGAPWASSYDVVLSTAEESDGRPASDRRRPALVVGAGKALPLEGRSFVVLRVMP